MTLKSEALVVDSVSVKFDDRSVLQNFSLKVREGELVALLGPSGSGKSTLLRAIMREVPIETGSIQAPDRVAYAPQRSPMLPWLTVLENVELARPKSLSRQLFRKAATETLKRVGLHDHLNMKSYKLSGGMRSRASLVRAFLMAEPLILLDEPFLGLDAVKRDLLHELTLDLWKESQPATIFVTHDLLEATKLANRIIVLSGSGSKLVLDRKVDRTDSSYVENDSFEKLRRELYEALRSA